MTPKNSADENLTIKWVLSRPGQVRLIWKKIFPLTSMRSWKINIPVSCHFNPSNQIEASREYILNKMVKLIGKRVRLEIDIKCEPIGYKFTIKSDQRWIYDTAFVLPILDDMTTQLDFDVEEGIEGVYRFMLREPNYTTQDSALFSAEITGFRLIYFW